MTPPESCCDWVLSNYSEKGENYISKSLASYYQAITKLIGTIIRVLVYIYDFQLVFIRCFGGIIPLFGHANRYGLIFSYSILVSQLSIHFYGFLVPRLNKK